MVYDVPVRAATAIATETMCRLAEHVRIVAVKDAKGALAKTSWVTRRTDLAVYSGDDALTLPSLAVGGVGLVGTSTHLTGSPTRRLIEAYEAGDGKTALDLHHQLLPLFTGIFKAQGVVLVKAALRLLGLPSGPVRLPQVDATDAEIAQLRSDAALAGVTLPEQKR
jgi:4-hydroxy-tetrahydrodipicolinate synthase